MFRSALAIVSAVSMAALVTSNSAIAEDVNRVVVGAYYYVEGIISDDRVRVIEVDRDDNRVKVLDVESNEVDWVSADKLITRTESIGKDVDRIKFVWDVFTALADDANKPAANEPAAQSWTPGAPHPQYAHVIASNDAGLWAPANGYGWVNREQSWAVSWQQNLDHWQYANVVSASTEGQWQPKEGYVWRNQGQSWDVLWSPGRAHSYYPNVLTAAEAGKWNPAPGYRWVDPTKTWDVVWVEGLKYSDAYPRVVSASTPGQWQPAPGYRWLDMQKWTVQWVPGQWHPKRAMVASSYEGVWSLNGAIGITFEMRNGLPVITTISDNGPAAGAGLQAGMTIRRIDGVPVENAPADAVMRLIAGSNGTPVLLECQRAQSALMESFRVVRQQLFLSSE